MPRPSAVLKMTALERRDVPAVVTPGDGWADARNLSLSFAPDGAAAGAATSTLNATFDALAPRAVWQREVLRAFQSWAAVTNVNVGLVADSGAAFGAAGEMQGDPRFGDIRVGGRPLSADAWAHAARVDRLSGTWAGDVLFNTAARFGVGADSPDVADVYSIALHEAAHVFGMDHSVVPGSAVSETYQGRSDGPILTDIATMQALHGGPRRADEFEGLFGNGSFSTATPLRGGGNLSVTADLTTGSDADVFRFTAAGGRFAVRLQTAGISLLTARVTLYDSLGRAVGADVSTDPTNGDLEVLVEGAVPGRTYYARVAGATADVFGVGRYRLAVDFAGRTAPAAAFAADGGSNDTRAAATALDRADLVSTLAGEPAFAANGVIESAGDADYYRLTTPLNPLASAPALVVNVRSLRTDRAAPEVAVFDAFGRPVPVQVLSTRDDEALVRLPLALPGATYFIRVTGEAGNYRLAADLLPSLAVPSTGRERLAAGYLSPERATLTSTLNRESSGLYQFSLGSARATAGAAVTLAVTDAAGRVVFTLTQRAGEEAAVDSVYLAAGSYTLTLTLSAPPGVDAKMWVMLDGEETSNPAGTYSTKSSSPSSGSGGSGTTSGSGGTTTASRPTTSSSTTPYGY